MKTDRFVFSHKDVTCPAGWEVIDNCKSDLDHRMWSEIAGIKAVNDRYSAIEEEKKKDPSGNTHPDFPPDFVVTAHYRRMPDPDCANRIYVAQPMLLPCSMYQHYAACHYESDMKTCMSVVADLHGKTIYDQFTEVLKGRLFIPYNIVCLPYPQFRDWANFLIKTLTEVSNRIGDKDYKARVERIKGREVPKFEGRNDDVKYQSRIEAFLSERLTTFYILQISKQVPVFPMSISKDKETF